MKPNDLPLLCLPMELSDEAAAKLIEFLHEITEALECHYAGQLLRYDRNRKPSSSPPPHDARDTNDTDPPF